MTDSEASGAQGVGIETALANALQAYYAWLAGREPRGEPREPLVVVPLRIAAEIATAARLGRADGRDPWGRDFQNTMARSRSGVIAETWGSKP